MNNLYMPDDCGECQKHGPYFGSAGCAECDANALPTPPPPNPVLAVPLRTVEYGSEHVQVFNVHGDWMLDCRRHIADAILAACNAFYAAPPETEGDVGGWTDKRYDVSGFNEQMVRASTYDAALRSLASVRAERDAAHEDAKACSIQLTEMHTRALRVERELTSLRSQVEGMREALSCRFVDFDKAAREWIEESGVTLEWPTVKRAFKAGADMVVARAALSPKAAP